MEDTISRAMADTPKRRPRRQFSEEFKQQAVRLVLDEGKSVAAVARELDADHPIRFALACLQLIVGWGAFFALGARLKRYR